MRVRNLELLSLEDNFRIRANIGQNADSALECVEAVGQLDDDVIEGLLRVSDGLLGVDVADGLEHLGDAVVLCLAPGVAGRFGLVGVLVLLVVDGIVAVGFARLGLAWLGLARVLASVVAVVVSEGGCGG